MVDFYYVKEYRCMSKEKLEFVEPADTNTDNEYLESRSR